jgi:CheY-like chemotaxis protein
LRYLDSHPHDPFSAPFAPYGVKSQKEESHAGRNPECYRTQLRRQPTSGDDLVNNLHLRRRRERARKILVVDDSLAWLRLAREILTAGGYQVQTCQDPREALSLLEQNLSRIDLVITDLQMPGLDGIELAAELLKINPTLPVVLTSAAMFRMPSEKLRSLGIRDFLTKPWDRGQLFSIIRQALARSLLEVLAARRVIGSLFRGFAGALGSQG